MVSVLKIVYKQYAVDIVLILNLGTVIGQCFFFNLISQDTITFMSMLKNKKNYWITQVCYQRDFSYRTERNLLLWLFVSFTVNI